jgi:hypothetical protein
MNSARYVLPPSFTKLAFSVFFINLYGAKSAEASTFVYLPGRLLHHNFPQWRCEYGAYLVTTAAIRFWRMCCAGSVGALAKGLPELYPRWPNIGKQRSTWGCSNAQVLLLKAGEDTVCKLKDSAAGRNGSEHAWFAYENIGMRLV